MNDIYSCLSICNATFPIEKKIVITDSPYKGHNILQALLLSGENIYNMDAETPSSLLTHLFFALPEASDYTLLSEMAHYLCIRHIYRDALSSGKLRYFQAIKNPHGLLHDIAAFFTLLRHHGLGSDALAPSMFIVPEKGLDLIFLYHAFETLLADKGTLTVASLPKIVQDSLKTGTPFPDDTLFIVYDDIAFPPAFVTCIRQIAPDKLYYMQPENAPKTTLPPAVQFNISATAADEVTDTLHYILHQQFPLDQVEIIVSHAHTYIPLLWQRLECMALPVTYQTGIPLYYTDVGKLALFYLDFLADDFSCDTLCSLFSSLTIDYGPFADALTDTPGMAALIRRCHIGWGKKRYVCDPPKEAPWLCDFFEELLAFFPDSPTGKTDFLALTTQFLAFIQRYAHTNEEKSLQVLTHIKNKLHTNAIFSDFPIDTEDWMLHMRHIVSQTYTLAGISRPGHLYVSDQENGGYTRRPHTFFLGATYEYVLGKKTHGALILDTEKQAISTRLTQKKTVDIARKNLYALLSRISQTLYITASCIDMAQNRDLLLLPDIVDIHNKMHPANIVSSDAFKDTFYHAFYRAFRDTLWTPAHMAKDTIPTQDVLQTLAFSQKPYLKQGHAAFSARHSTDLSAWDGYVGKQHAHDAVLTQRPLSASALETLARCPFLYYMRYILDIRPIYGMPFQKDIPLPHQEKGSLLHRMFHDIMQYAQHTGLPVRDLDKQTLRAMTDSHLQTYKRNRPAYPPGTWATIADMLQETVDLFLLKEAHCPEWRTPILLEYPFGQKEGLVCEIGDRTFRLSGKVDRVDKIGPHLYMVLDYKTGRPTVTATDYFKGGRHLQPTLYAYAISKCLKKEGLDPMPQVTHAGYYFPTRHGKNKEMMVPLAQNDGLARILALLFDIMESGIYMLSPDIENSYSLCASCDFRPSCMMYKPGAIAAKYNTDHPYACKMAKLETFD